MKVFRKLPKTEVRVRKLDSAVEEYEFWLVKPVLIGHAVKLGSQRIQTEDGKMFSNLESVINHYVDGIPDRDIREQLSKSHDISVQGLDLVEQGLWPKFCRMNDINPKDMQAMQRNYRLSDKDARKLGLE